MAGEESARVRVLAPVLRVLWPVPEPATPPSRCYELDETDPPVTEWSEPITLDAPTAKARLRHDTARDQYRTRR